MGVTRSNSVWTLGLFAVFAVATVVGGEETSNGRASQVARDHLARTTPVWFDEAKLGIFIHWNAASIPAFAPVTTSIQNVTPVTSAEALRAERMRRGTPTDSDELRSLRSSPWTESYGQTMLIPGSATGRYHAEHYGGTPYETFVEQFRDEVIPGWDPEPWADLFVRAGARYVVLTARQADGFLLWPSVHRNPRRERWQSERDVVGELAAAVRARGLRFGTYYSGGVEYPMNTTQPLTADMWRAWRANRRTEEARLQIDAHWRELIERYRPEVLWSEYFYPGASRAVVPGEEGPLDPIFKEQAEDLFRFYVRNVPEGVINNRFGGLWQSSGKLYTDFVTPEYTTDPDGGLGRPKGSNLKWEVNRGMGTSYGYNRLEDDGSYMSANELIHTFVDIVARGGNLLINVGPTSSGEIPWPQAERLLALGWWLRTNGAAIYGTQPWERSDGMTGEGLEVRYTATKDAVFAILLGAAKSRAVELDLRLDDGVYVTLEGTSRDLRWQATPAGVRVELPTWPEQRPAVSLRFTPRSGVRPE